MITTGVTGGSWRASVTEWGAVEPWDGGPLLDWCVAADDRWHVAAQESAVRQKRLGGTAVVETRLRIPEGDAVQRVYSVADEGGLTVVEVENESPLPIAVAFTRGDLLTVLPPAAPIDGISLPAGSIAVPVGHRSTVRVALAHDGRGAGTLPGQLPTSAGVVRGWCTTTEQAGRLVLPEGGLDARVTALRCELLLNGPDVPDEDPIGFLIGVGQLVRMGEAADDWVPDVAFALERSARGPERGWTHLAAMDAARVVLLAAGERRALRDLTVMERASADESSGEAAVATGPLPTVEPTGAARFLAWAERRLVAPTDQGAALMLGGFPAEWLGGNLEVYGLPTGTGGTVSFALRWHGERPAVLWEQTGEPAVLTAPLVAPGWSVDSAAGEALWPAPPQP